MDARHARSFVPNRWNFSTGAPGSEGGTVLLRIQKHTWFCLGNVVLFPPRCHDRSHLAANTRYSSSSSSSSTFQAAKTHAEKTINPLLLSSPSVSLPSSILFGCVRASVQQTPFKSHHLSAQVNPFRGIAGGIIYLHLMTLAHRIYVASLVI